MKHKNLVLWGIGIAIACAGCSHGQSQVENATDSHVNISTGDVSPMSAEALLKENPIGQLSVVFKDDSSNDDQDASFDENDDDGENIKASGFVYIVYGNVDDEENDGKIILFPADRQTGSDVGDFAEEIKPMTDRMVKYLYSLTMKMDDKLYVVVVDGTGYLDGKKITAYSLGYLTSNTYNDAYDFNYGYDYKRYMFVENTEDLSVLYHFAVTDSGDVYLYKSEPKAYADLPVSQQLPECTDVISAKSEIVFEYNDFSIGIGDNDFEHGQISLPQAVNGLNAVIKGKAKQNNAIVLQTLESASGEYDLVKALSRGGESKDYRLNKVVQVDGVNAYDISVGSYINDFFNLMFRESGHYLVAQNGKIYTYSYNPVLIGNLKDIESSLVETTYMFAYKYDDNGTTSWGMDGVMRKSAPDNDKCGDDDCPDCDDDERDREDDEEYDEYDEPDDDNGGFCVMSELGTDDVESYIVDNYIKKYDGPATKKGWLIYFANNGDYNGEETYEVYVGHDRNRNNTLDVLYRFTVTASGKIYQMDKSGNRKQVGEMKGE